MAVITSPAVAENGSIVETIPPKASDSEPWLKNRPQRVKSYFISVISDPDFVSPSDLLNRLDLHVLIWEIRPELHLVKTFVQVGEEDCNVLFPYDFEVLDDPANFNVLIVNIRRDIRLPDDGGIVGIVMIGGEVKVNQFVTSAFGRQ